MKPFSLIILLLGISILSFLLGYLLSNTLSKSITGQSVTEIPKEYTYTKAICNNNQCLDILIECKNHEVISLKPQSHLKDKSPDFQVPNNQNAYLFWNLKFGAFLGFGIWDLMLSCVL